MSNPVRNSRLGEARAAVYFSRHERGTIHAAGRGVVGHDSDGSENADSCERMVREMRRFGDGHQFQGRGGKWRCDLERRVRQVWTRSGARSGNLGARQLGELIVNEFDTSADAFAALLRVSIRFIWMRFVSESSYQSSHATAVPYLLNGT